MPLTTREGLPTQTVEKREWTMRPLFPFAKAVDAVTKLFVNPYDILLGFIILVIGAAQLMGRHVAWGFYLIAILILAATIFERHPNLFNPTQNVE